MKLKFIWSLSLPMTLIIGLGLGLVWLILLIGLGGGQSASLYLNSVNSGLVAIMLVCSFLLRLKAGKGWQRSLLDEFFPVGTLIILLISVIYLALVLASPAETFTPGGAESDLGVFFLGIRNPLLGTWVFTLIFGGGSYFVVRIAGWVYYFWNSLRRRSLVWEITHTQLRLVMLVMYSALLFYVFTLPANYRSLEVAGSGSVRFLQLLTTLIVLLGFTGVVTGILFIIVLIPATVLSYFSARQITRRLANLVESTAALSAGNYATRVSIEGKDEVAHLQTNFNLMADKLDETVQRLQTEKQAIARLLESRQTLFAGVSHELRTPVSTLRSYLEIVRQKSAVPPELENYLVVMEEETLHLQRLIDDLFMLARSDVRQLELNLQPLDVTSVLQRCVEAARLQAWQSKKLDVALEIRPPLPPVYADETRLEQVVNNLLKNAVRHTMPGGIVAVSVEVESAHLAIIVRDTGEGIAPTDLPHIWERFYRSADARASDRNGAGLGLPIVKELTTAMGGTVEVESTVGEGSCFCVRLPLAT